MSAQLDGRDRDLGLSLEGKASSQDLHVACERLDARIAALAEQLHTDLRSAISPLANAGEVQSAMQQLVSKAAVETALLSLDNGAHPLHLAKHPLLVVSLRVRLVAGVHVAPLRVRRVPLGAELAQLRPRPRDAVHVLRRRHAPVREDLRARPRGRRRDVDDLVVELARVLEVDDEGWQEIEGIDIFEMMDEDGETSDDDMMMWIMESAYQLEEGDWSMSWTLDGLDPEGQTYSLLWAIEEPGDTTFICGNGDEIPFDYVNDEEEDCEDGADEQQYDNNGDPINWFDCEDGSEIWIYQVNDGNDDCPNGEDESGSNIEYEETFDSDNATMTFEWDLDVPSMCIMMIGANLQEDNGNDVGFFMAFIAGDLWEDEDGDNDDARSSSGMSGRSILMYSSNGTPGSLNAR